MRLRLLAACLLGLGRAKQALAVEPPFLSNETDSAEYVSLYGEGRHFKGRPYRLGVPDGYDPAEGARGLIIMLHGFFNTPEDIYNKFVDLLSIPEGPFLVAPTGSSDYGMPASWHTLSSETTNGPDGPLCDKSVPCFGCATNMCGAARKCHRCMPWFKCSNRCVWSTCADDHAYITELLDHMEATYKIDSHRIFLAGFSNGGIMVWDVAGHPALSKRFAAVSTLNGSPQAGFARSAAHPDKFPRVIGIWSARSPVDQDGKMPPYSNIVGRPDKSHTTAFPFGNWYYNTAANATQTYVKRLHNCDKPGISLDTIMQPASLKENFQCWDDGCNGRVVRCDWLSSEHTIAVEAHMLVWRFFLLAAEERFGRPACPASYCGEPWAWTFEAEEKVRNETDREKVNDETDKEKVNDEMDKKGKKKKKTKK